MHPRRRPRRLIAAGKPAPSWCFSSMTRCPSTPTCASSSGPPAEHCTRPGRTATLSQRAAAAARAVAGGRDVPRSSGQPLKITLLSLFRPYLGWPPTRPVPWHLNHGVQAGDLQIDVARRELGCSAGPPRCARSRPLPGLPLGGESGSQRAAESSPGSPRRPERVLESGGGAIASSSARHCAAASMTAARRCARPLRRRVGVDPLDGLLQQVRGAIRVLAMPGNRLRRPGHLGRGCPGRDRDRGAVGAPGHAR